MQCEMSPDLVVVGSVTLQETTQVRLTEHDCAVETLTAQRPDKSLDVPVVPSENSNSDVVMVETAENGQGGDAAA